MSTEKHSEPQPAADEAPGKIECLRLSHSFDASSMRARALIVEFDADEDEERTRWIKADPEAIVPPER